jgi:hypothetical protein
MTILILYMIFYLIAPVNCRYNSPGALAVRLQIFILDIGVRK